MIIGITGTLGAGKGTVVKHLVERYGFTHYSVRDFLIAEIDRRGLERNRDTMLLVANDLRAQHGPGYISERLLAAALRAGGDAVIESIRSVGEGEHLKENGAALWAVDADIKKRYERIAGRGSETDHVSFEKFAADEQEEFSNTDAAKPNLKAVIAMADAVLYNNGTPGELEAQVEAALRAAT